MKQAIKCPHCDEVLESDEDISGDTIACPSCDQDFTVPVKIQIKVPAKKFMSIKKPLSTSAEYSANHSSSYSQPDCGEQKVVLTDVDLSFGTVFSITLKVLLSMFVISLAVGTVFGLIFYLATH